MFSLLVITNNLYSYDNSKNKVFDNVLEKYYQIYWSTRTIPVGMKQHILRYKIKPLEYKRRKEIRRYNSIKSKRNNQNGLSTMGVDNSISGETLKKGEMYCYPNPAKGIKPKFHIETGIADMAEIEVYDITGKKVDGIKIEGTPQIIDDGQGPEYAYEAEWDTTNTGSGVYIIYVRSYRGDKKIEGRFKCAVIK